MATSDALDGGGGKEKVGTETSDLAGLVRHYRDTSSMHGVTQVGDKQLYNCRRWLWVLLMLGMLCGLITLMYLHFIRYISYPTVTVLNAHVLDSVAFPAVTICNLNQFHRQRIPDDGRLKQLIYRLSDYAFLNKNEIFPLGANGIEWTGEELKNFSMYAAHSLAGMFKYCVFHAQSKSCKEVLNTTVTDLGVCYTFNADPESRLISSDSGPVGGLRLIMNIEQDFYYFSKNTQSGIKVLLHEPDEVPLLTNRGFFVRPGTCTDVVIRREQRTSLSKPYKAFGNSYCLDTRKSDYRSHLTLYSNYSYTEAACWQDCYTRRLVAKCGCRHFFDPGDDKLCSLHELETCYIPNAELLSMEDAKHCDCHAPCSEVTYTTSLSFTDYASKFIVQQLFNNNVVTNPNFVRENIIELRVYYGSLTVSDIVQEPEMSISGILGELGGHMGLFLGASILTVTEVVEMVILAACSCCLGRWICMTSSRKTPASPIIKQDKADSVF